MISNNLGLSGVSKRMLGPFPDGQSRKDLQVG